MLELWKTFGDGEAMTGLKMLDCFCGLGGASMGFAKEGFDCTGIDVVNVGYPYRFILADMLSLKGEDFRGYDVIWLSPPCRHWSSFARIYGSTWKNKPDPEGQGMKLVNASLTFVERAQPKFWIMENTDGLVKYLGLKPRFVTYLSLGSNNQGKKHGFWGNFPSCLIPKDNRKKPITYHKIIQGKRYPKSANAGKLESWINAKIPLACSQAFARACKDVLLEKELTV